MADDTFVVGAESPGGEYGADGVEPEEAPLLLDQDSPNLALDLAADPRGKDILAKVGGKVHSDFEKDWKSCEEHREICKGIWRLFAGELLPKNHPWRDCANLHVPIVLENISRVQSLVMGEVFGDFQNVMSHEPVTPDDAEAARSLTIHHNWQIRTQLTDFSRQQERGILSLLNFGDKTSHSFYDAEARVNRLEVCTPDDFVVPYVYVSTAIDWSDVPRRCKVLNHYRHQLQAMRDQWHDVDALLSGKTESNGIEQDIAESAAKTQGIEKPDTDKYGPRKLILYEGWCELLNDYVVAVGKDGTPGKPEKRDRFIQAIVDHATKHVLSLTIHEEDDWRDKQRYELEVAQAEAFAQHAEQRQQMQAQIEQMQMAVMAGQAPPEVLQQVPELGPEPPAPQWMIDGDDGPAPVKRVPIHMFTHVVDIENLWGSLGIGHGRILADLNRLANVAGNQFIDAASLGNGRGYFGTIKFPGGIKWGPGVYNEAPAGVSPEELKNGMIPMDMGPGNPQLLDLVRMAREFAGAAMQADPGALGGNPGKSGETWRGFSARLEQANKQISAVSRKFVVGLKRELELNAKLNSIYLPEHEIVLVADHPGGAIPVGIGREMYAKKYAIEVKASLRFATQAQKVGEADEIVQMVGAMPPLQQNPAIVYAALKKAFLARGMDEMVPLLGPEPPPPQFPMGMAPPPPGAPPGQSDGAQGGGDSNGGPSPAQGAPSGEAPKFN